MSGGGGKSPLTEADRVTGEQEMSCDDAAAGEQLD